MSCLIQGGTGPKSKSSLVLLPNVLSNLVLYVCGTQPRLAELDGTRIDKVTRGKDQESLRRAEGSRL